MFHHIQNSIYMYVKIKQHTYSELYALKYIEEKVIILNCIILND